MPLIDHPSGTTVSSPHRSLFIAVSSPLLASRSLMRRCSSRCRIEPALNGSRGPVECGGPKSALCGIELRSHDRIQFAGLPSSMPNRSDPARSGAYSRRSQSGSALPTSRRRFGAPGESVLYGFSYTQPAVGFKSDGCRRGGGELRKVCWRESDHRAGRYVAAGAAAKATFVMELMENRLRDWEATGRR